MSGMDGNPYGTATKVSATEHEDDEHWGNTQAVMALAYEQRTANLISLMDHVRNDDTMEALKDVVFERVGLITRPKKAAK